MSKQRMAPTLVTTGALTVALGISVMAAGPTAAQPVATLVPGPGSAVGFEVVGVEYAYLGLPASVPAGSSLGFRNDGLELHELALARIADETTESLEELMAMGDAAVTEGKVEVVEGARLIAQPGETAEGTLTLGRAGRYIAICLVPQGFAPSILAELGVTEDMAPEDWPPEAQAILDNPTHAALGMVREFRVASAGTEIGPLPGIGEDGSAGTEVAAPSPGIEVAVDAG